MKSNLGTFYFCLVTAFKSLVVIGLRRFQPDECRFLLQFCILHTCYGIPQSVHLRLQRAKSMCRCHQEHALNTFNGIVNDLLIRCS